MSAPISVRPMAASEAVAKAATGDIALLDVRETAELQASGKAHGAHHVPLGLVSAKLHHTAPDLPEGLTKDTPIAIYCAKGGRAQQAAAQLADMGYTQVFNIGGFEDWCAAGGKIED